MQVNLKRATIGDISTLVEIEKKLIDYKIYSAMTDEAEWQEEFKKGNAAVYLILNNDTVVGNASFERNVNESAHISGLAIMPEFQKMGIGRRVLEMILEELKEVKTITLATHPENIAALKLYKSFGFVEKEKIENYFGDGEPRVILKKE